MYYTTNIFSLGNSHAVRLPKKLLDALSFSDNEAVTITSPDNKSVLIQRAVPDEHKKITERFRGYSGDYSAVEWDTGLPVGKEIRK